MAKKKANLQQLLERLYGIPDTRHLLYDQASKLIDHLKTYKAVQLIESKGRVDTDSVKYITEQVNGSFSFSILDHDNNHYIVKGDSPISLLHFKRLGVYAYASTDSILYRALVQTCLLGDLKAAMNGGDGVECVDVKDGTILKIDKAGTIETAKFDYDEYGSFSYGWWDWDTTKGRQSADDPIVDELKSIVSSMGFDPDDVDRLLNEGYTIDEIADILYAYEVDDEDENFDERQVEMCGI